MIEMNYRPKVSIIGCGNVGMRYAYAMLINGLARELVLIDIDKKRVQGEAMDLEHCIPFTEPVNIIVGEYSDLRGADLVVITSGKNQQPGQSRLALVKDNVEIFKDIISNIMKYSPNSVILVVSNPVDILSYATYKISGKSSSEVIGSGTTLDTSRLKSNISRHCGVDARNIHAYIIGEHGDTELALWSSATVGGVLLKDFCRSCNSCDFEKEIKDRIFNDVKKSAYKIIEKKGETSYGIGLSLVSISRTIIEDQNSVFPVSSLVKGYLDIEDVYLSRPCIINKKGISKVLDLKMNETEQDQFKKSADSLKDIIHDLKF
jgi:L-lactate dehydrogenase